MKKTPIIIVSIVILVALILFLPIPQGSYDDGGTRGIGAVDTLPDALKFPSVGKLHFLKNKILSCSNRFCSVNTGFICHIFPLFKKKARSGKRTAPG